MYTIIHFSLLTAENQLYHQQKQKLLLTPSQKDWLNPVLSFHQNSLDIWLKTIDKKSYPWDSDPSYCNQDSQERLQYNAKFLQKLWELILDLEIGFLENKEALKNKFGIDYDNVIDIFTITFINRLDREFKQCLVKYKEYSIPNSIKYVKAAILFQNKTEFNQSSSKTQKITLDRIKRHQREKRSEIDLIEYAASLAIKQGDESCKQIANEMMKANKEYLKIDLKYRQRKKSSKNSSYYRSSCWESGKIKFFKNGSYQN